ncbi:MAG TPA: nuclear transport factor 2 family protein [Usitatibacter sp.]|nr:nuclear transport factor 2 family protein [Usitatibacter sp.]
MKPRRSKLFPTPDDAASAFYDAFERADLPAMMAVWAESDDVVCVHPRGVRLVGFEAVRQSWAQIFAGGSRLRVATTDPCSFEGPSIAVQSVVELVSAPGSEADPTPVSATNVFELTEHGWRLVIHHASPLPKADPAPEEEPPGKTHVLH